MKVKDLPYKRYTTEEAEAILKQCTADVKNAKSAAEVIDAHNRAIDAIEHFSTMSSLAHMRYTLNSFDDFYTTEKEYYDAAYPVVNELRNDFGKAMLASPFAEEVKKTISPIVFETYRILAAASDPRIIEDLQEEAEVVSEYSKLMAEMTFHYDGKEMPLAVLKGYLSDENREVRRTACETLGMELGLHAYRLDDIFDRLVHIRDRMAKKLGYKNYVELGYLNMQRMDYNREMVEKFRESVLRDLVPVVTKIKHDIAKEMGIYEFKFYDDAISFSDGEPKPISDKDEIFRRAQIMYDKMSPEIGAFMRSMQENEAFDVDARRGKWGGGYCTSFDDFKQAFILANFNGSTDDIDVITHEFGHALAMDLCFKYGDRELGVGGMETAECHSMSMEFFSWPYMDLFFGEDADKYRYKHLLSALSFIPYGTIIDEFQHIIYSNPDLTPSERNKVYADLERKYRPYLSFANIPYLQNGTRWQYQMHVFESPFYYIDYCLAQTVALGFLLDSQNDYQGALKRYLDFAKAGGTVPFGKLCTNAGLVSPFADGALRKIARQIPELLRSLKKYVPQPIGKREMF